MIKQKFVFQRNLLHLHWLKRQTVKFNSIVDMSRNSVVKLLISNLFSAFFTALITFFFFKKICRLKINLFYLKQKRNKNKIYCLFLSIRAITLLCLLFRMEKFYITWSLLTRKCGDISVVWYILSRELSVH